MTRSKQPDAVQEAPPTGGTSAVMSAARRLLRPLVRLLIGQQVPFPALSGLLKEVYVEVAERDFPLDGKRATDSRITLMTGVHRKDVARIRSERSGVGQGGESGSPQVASLGAQLVARWLADPACVDDAGHALPLPRRAISSEAGQAAPSFEALVRSVSTDIRPRAVLDEWLRLGIAELDDTDRVMLRHDAFIPAEGFQEKAHFLGWNVHDHLAAAVANLTDPPSEQGRPLFERAVFYARLRSESVDELAEAARELGMDALTELNRKAAALQARDAGHPDALHRMRFGSYFYRAALAEADETANGDLDASDDAEQGAS